MTTMMTPPSDHQAQNEKDASRLRMILHRMYQSLSCLLAQSRQSIHLLKDSCASLSFGLSTWEDRHNIFSHQRRKKGRRTSDENDVSRHCPPAAAAAAERAHRARHHALLSSFRVVPFRRPSAIHHRTLILC